MAENTPSIGIVVQATVPIDRPNERASIANPYLVERMQILFVAGREMSYARNDVLLRALRRMGSVDVVAPAAPPASLLRSSATVTAQAVRRLVTRRYDLVFVGFYGSLILPHLRPLTHSPIFFDAFISNYDTLAFDRGAFAPNSLRGRLALALDRIPSAMADAILLDTQAHVEYFIDVLGVDARKLHALPVGCNEEIFYPFAQAGAARLPGIQDDSASRTTVFYYCTYLPLHGVETVLHAAAYLEGLDIHFHLVGDGPMRPAMEALALSLRLRHTRFLAPMHAAMIADKLRGAHIALGGHFGPSAKAQRTIPGKIYQMLACERAVVAADSPANRELLVHGRSAWLVPPQDPPALALAILALHDNPSVRAEIAAGGRAAFLASASEEVIRKRLAEIVRQLAL